jgi:Methyltransferase domain
VTTSLVWLPGRGARVPYRWIAREILVNVVGYRLGVRSVIGRGKVANVVGSVEGDVEDKGHRRLAFIKQTLRGFLGEAEFRAFWPPRCVVEIGPGGTLLLGLYLLSEGVAEYVGIDRFASDVWGEYPRRCYRYALRTLPAPKHLERLLVSSAAGQGPLHYRGTGGHRAFRTMAKRSVDLIFSWGVFEHIDDPRQMLSESREVIGVDGLALHIIDPHAHTWLRFANPLLFLAVPDWLWWLMYAGRGFQTRHRASAYARWAAEAGYDVYEVMREMESAKHLWIKPYLLPRFRQATDADVLTHRIGLALVPRRD